MSIEFTTGIAQNDTIYIEAAPGAFAVGDTQVVEGTFAPVTRKRRGGEAPHNGGKLIRTLKVVGAGDEFDAQPDSGSRDVIMRQRFYCEVINEERIYN